MRASMPWEVSHFSGVKFHVECIQNHVWGHLGARVISIFVKTYMFGKVELGDNHGWKEH